MTFAFNNTYARLPGRFFARLATGETVFRETALPGAVLVRVARRHVRVGTFEYFQARQDTDALRQLADYTIARHYPEAKGSDRPYRALLEAVLARQAGLVARWLGVGFIHGVMNTDNMSISGETIDYGPCAFMDAYHPGRVYSSIDHGGRYAYGSQPRIASGTSRAWPRHCFRCLTMTRRGRSRRPKA